MKILRFNDDRIGVLKGEDRVVDVSGVISYRVEKSPKRAIEEVIEGFEHYRDKFQRSVDREHGVPLNTVKLLAPIPQPNKCLAAFVNYTDRPDRIPENLAIEYFYKSPELVGPGGTIELPDIPPVTGFHPEAEIAFVIGKLGKDRTSTRLNSSHVSISYAVFCLKKKHQDEDTYKTDTIPPSYSTGQAAKSMRITFAETILISLMHRPYTRRS